MRVADKSNRWRWRGNAVRCLSAALALSFTLLLAAPLTILTTNPYEFAFGSAELLRALLPAFAVSVVVLSAVLALLPSAARQHAVSTVFVLGVLLWLQGNVLVWDYGALDGRDIDWLGMWPQGLVDGAVWLAGLALALRYAAWITRRLVTSGAVVLILIQALALAPGLAAPDPLDKYRVDVSEKYVFSETKNVVVLVADAFQSDLFQEVIDAEPELAGVFDGFVYFRNAVAAFRQSFPSVPNMLTGTYFDNSRPMWEYVREAYLGPSSLPRLLRQAGYRVDVYEHAAGMYFHPEVVSNVRLGTDYEGASGDILFALDVALFRYTPHLFKPLVYQNQLWLLSRWLAPPAPSGTPAAADPRASTVEPLFPLEDRRRLPNLRDVDEMVTRARLGGRQPAFKFYHLHGTHLPLRMNRDFEYVEPEPTRAALRELAVGVIRLLDLIFERLRALGVYDDALIVIAADHGLWTAVAEVVIPPDLIARYPERAAARGPLPERKGSVLPLVLVKRIGAAGPLRISDAPVALGDIPRTVASELGFDADGFPGASMFELGEDEPRERVVHFSTFRSNPSYSEPYRSPMTEFVVDGFSWLDGSWRATGRVYSPPEP